MAQLAFYAPMKSPNHATPSGDREMARNLMSALTDPARDCGVDLVSEFRCYDGQGCAELQADLIRRAEKEAACLTDRAGWDAWVTYHSYYKAPDLLGPQVSKALDIPYIQIEATRAAKRLGGPWDYFARVSDAASDAANAIFYFTRQDYDGLAPYQRADQPLVHLRPFLACQSLPEPASPKDRCFLSVGMMRQGDKLASYQIIAEALARLDGGWCYEIAGDGPARSEVEALFAPFGARVRFLGELGPQALQKAYGKARALLWPGVNEAFGMVYLEAQAAGVPIVAQDRPGVSDVVPQSGLWPVGDTTALAQDLSRLLNDNVYWQSRRNESRFLIEQHHLLGAARSTLWSVINPLLQESA